MDSSSLKRGDSLQGKPGHREKRGEEKTMLYGKLRSCALGIGGLACPGYEGGEGSVKKKEPD